MSLLTNIALGLGGIAAGSAAWGGLTNSYSEYHQGAWDWQYKGAAFRNRLGEFSFYSDNKSRYNEYLKDYGSVIGYKANLSSSNKITSSRSMLDSFSDVTYEGGVDTSGNNNLAVFGNPTGANTTDSNNYILENRVRGKSLFVTSYNNEKRRPNWVAYNINKNNIGSTGRQEDFRHDDSLPANFNKQYSGTIKGLQRGHNAPSGLFTADAEMNSATYVMSNISYQVPNVNEGPWKDLEHYLASTAKGNIFTNTKGKNIDVISGNAGVDESKGTVNGIQVPKLIWKVAIIREHGQALEDAKSIVSVMVNDQEITNNWQNTRLQDGTQIRKLTGIKRLIPSVSLETENKILSDMYEPPSDKSKLLNLDTIGSNFKSAAMERARSRGIHNPLMAPLYDADRSYKGIVISNKRTHSEQFEMARYNASMRATGRFTSVVDIEDMTTFQNILQASKPIGTNLTEFELRVAKAFDFAVNTPSLASRINEYFFIPMGMGRVYKEEKGPIPSLFGAVGGLIDQAFLINNPALRSYKNDGENYFTTKTSFFQDLLENSTAGILATASSIGVYLAVGEPLKAMASEAILQTQETILNAADTNIAAKSMLSGDITNTVGFKMSLIERNINQGKDIKAYYDVNTPSFSLYYLDNYARHRGASFFAATAQDFLLNKVSPYEFKSPGHRRLISALNDYVEVLQSPADIRIIQDVGDVTMHTANMQQWNNATITTASGATHTIPDALAILRAKDDKGKYIVTETVANEINEAVNKKYTLKIENVSIERNLQLAKKLQGILNVVPMPWAWGIFTGRTKSDVTGPMIGNLLDIEGFARHVNASIQNQGFWGAANEYMIISKEGNKTANPAFRIVNHLATMTRSILAFNEQGGKSKADLEDIMRLTNTYSDAESKLDDTLAARGKTSVKTSSAKGYTVFDTTNMADDEVRMLLDNEAHYQAEWKKLSKNRPELQTITLDKELFKYAGQAADGNALGYALNLLDKGGTYTGMKVASTKLSAAKWIIGALFIPQLVGTEYLQRTGMSLAGSFIAQSLLTTGTTTTVAELQSTNFVSAKEVARGMGLDVNTSNLIGGAETLVSMAGIANWAYNHASTFAPEIHANVLKGQRVFDMIDAISISTDSKGLATDYKQVKGLQDIQNIVGKGEGLSAKIGSTEVAFNIVRDSGKIVGLQALNAKVMKNMTSFTISLGLTLAAMQTARYVVSSAINSERQLTGSAFLSTYLLALPATILAATSMADNMVHTINLVAPGKYTYNNYKLTHNTAKAGLYALQGVNNMMFKNGITTAVSLSLLAATAWLGYTHKLTPFQGDINGPKADELNMTAMTKLGSYVAHVNRRIQEAKERGMDNAISERVSPLEVNAALLAVSLGKIMNPILSSQKGSTAYVTAIQSPTPIFQFYSVIKKIEDRGGSSYTTVGLGLQGPPAFGFAPVNISLPIAFAMNRESSNGEALKTGYFGSGIVLNENNKDGLSLNDYASIYGQIALWSSVGLKVSSTFINNRSWGSTRAILKAGGTFVPSEPLLIQSMRSGRDKFMGIATLPFSIAMQSMKLATGDLRMPSLRLTGSSFMPLIFNAVAAGVFSQFLVGVHREATLPFKDSQDKSKKDTSWNWWAIGSGALGWTSYQYYKGTIAASRTLASLEDVLITEGPDSVKFDKTNIDPITRALYANKNNAILQNIHKFKTQGLQGGLDTIGKFINTRKGKAIGLVIAGSLWNHFLTDPNVGKINPQIAYGNLRDDTEDTYSLSYRRLTTVGVTTAAFVATASLSTLNIWNFTSTIDYESMIDNYEVRLKHVKGLEKSLKDTDLKGEKNITTFRKWANLQYERMKLNQQGWEVQAIYEGDMNKSPMIEFLDEKGKELKNALKQKDPTANLRQVAKERGTAAFTNLQQLDTTAGTDLNSIAKNNKADVVIDAIKRGYTDQKLTDPIDKKANLTAALKNSSWLGGGNNAIRTRQIANFAKWGAAVGFVFNFFNWGANAFGYKDFQDVFLKEDQVGNNSWMQGIVDAIKMMTRHDRANNYEIANGLVGPNFKTSEGEFLLSPETTVKGSLNKAIKNLQKLTLFNSPNIFVGAELGGITIRADNSDARIRDYFQLQSASQDFSSAMYSMSAVFGLQELAKKGFLANAIVAKLRGIDDGQDLNQNQLRSFGADIITAVYSQPIRQGKDRIKFTAPDKFTLDAMQTNKALSMSLNQRYKTLRSLSYANMMQLANFTLLNNMSIADPAMQNKIYKALMRLNEDDQMGLGEISQNFFMGGKLDVNKVILKGKNDSPFTPFKLSIEETNSENAFSDSMGLAMRSTTNQYIEPKNLLETITSNAGQLLPSSIKSMGQMPGPLLLAMSILGIGGLLVAASAVVFSFSKSQVTKENTALYRQQSKFYDEGDWFSKNKVEAVQLQGAAQIEQAAQQLKTSQYLLFKRAGVVFNIAEGLDSSLITQYTKQINELAGDLSFTFDSNYRNFSKNYGQAVDYEKLNEFYDKQVSTTTTTTDITKEQRIDRNYARSFTPIMGDPDLKITYAKDQKIIDHLLDEFTNKQLLDAYLEGQYEAYRGQNDISINNKGDFAKKYYPGFTYDDLLQQQVNKSFIRVTDKTKPAHDLNIFGKDRNADMSHSINRMKEVYAAKFDVIIDTYFDVLETRVNDTFKEFPDRNIYTEFIGSDVYEIDKPTSQAEITSHLTNRRMEMKQQLRANISDELTRLFAPKISGMWAFADNLLTLVKGGKVENNLARISLGAANAAKDTIMEIRSQGGKVFGGRGNMGPNTELGKAAIEAAENQLKITTGQGVSNSMNAGPTPSSIKTNLAGKSGWEFLTYTGSLIMNAFQAAQFASTNLLTLRAAASIASSKTGEKEKEMAKEEMAKEGFENMFAGLFWGAVFGNESLKAWGIPAAAGLVAGYMGYDFMQKNKIMTVGMGIGLTVGGSLLFKNVNKHWGLSVALMGLTLVGRSVFDMTPEALKTLSPELGNYISEQGDRFQNFGRSGFRLLQDNSAYVTTPTGLLLGVGGVINARNGNPLINLGVATVGALLFGTGIAKLTEDKRNVNHKADAASRAGLHIIANMVASKYIDKKLTDAAGNLVTKTVGSRITEEIAKNRAIQATGEMFTKAANSTIGKNIAKTALAKTVAMGAGKIALAAKGLGSLLGSFFAGPWGFIFTLAYSIFQLVSILTIPDEMDNLTSNLSHMPSQWMGIPDNLLLSSSNQIYNDRKYKDVDARNPLFYGTVTDALKEQWLEQVSTMDDITGRSAAGRNTTSFDAPMTGYDATARGYGPKGLDPVEDMAQIIRARLYTQQVTGRQYRNTKIDESMNREIIQQRMTTAEKLQVQMWERQINNAVDTQNRQITGKPPTSAEQLKSANKEAMNIVAQGSISIKQSLKAVEDIINKPRLGLIMEQSKIPTDPTKQIFLNGEYFNLMANKVEVTTNDLGQKVFNFNKTTAPNAEIIAIQYANQGIDHVTANTLGTPT